MQKLGANELHDEKINREDPDWRLVYEYFTALLNADELPSLGQIGESSTRTFSDCTVIVFIDYSQVFSVIDWRVPSVL